jgi:hypothetical protein
MPEAIIDEAYDFLRAHLAGRIRFDGDRVEIRVAPAPDGGLVAPVMVSMLRSIDVVLELPDDGEDSLELQVTLTEIKEDGPEGALCDRWSIYHGEPPDVRWARFAIDAARYKGNFIDGIALTRANAFAEDEPALCKQANAGRTDLLEAAALRQGGHRLEKPLLVGVDPWGFDLRTRLGIARVVAHPPIATAQDVLPRLETLAKG